MTPLSTWWVHLFHVDEAYLSPSHFFILSMFSGCAGNRSFFGRSGCNYLVMHSHGAVPVSMADDSNVAPTLGKFFGITPSWTRASRER